MKYWQLGSMLRDENAILEELIQDDKWPDFKNYYLNKNEFIANQRREVLDRNVPKDLVTQALIRSKKVLLINNDYNMIYTFKNIYTVKEMPILDLYEIIGGDIVEELLEKTRIDILDDQIKAQLIKWKS